MLKKRIVFLMVILGAAFVYLITGPQTQALVSEDAVGLGYGQGGLVREVQVINGPESPVSFIAGEERDETSGGTPILPETLEYVPNEIVFKLAGSDGYSRSQSIQAQQLVQQIAQKHKFERTVQVFAHRVQGPLRQIYVARLSAGISPIEACKKLKADPAIEWVEPNYYYNCQMTPNDTYYNSSGSWGQGYADMWGLHAVNPEEAWDQTQGDSIIVAVIDTGVDYNHEDLQENIWADSNGYYGYDFVNNDNDPMDDYGHGTHCAGIIAAVGNNSKGIIGVAPNAKIMIVKGLNSSGSGTATDLAKCITYAADNDANVLSNSWGGGGKSQLIEDAVEYAKSRNCVVVAAAGNSSLNAALFFPANIQDILTVAALDPSLNLASFSNYGSVVDFSAPGVDVLSLRAAGTDIYGGGGHFVPAGDPNAKYYRANGTSMACPFVSGLAALVLAQDPYLSETAVRRAIAASAGTLGISNVYVGTGVVDAEAALGIIDEVSDVDANIVFPKDDLDPLPTVQPLDINGTADGDSYVLDFGEGYYPNEWTTISTGTSVINGLLGTLDLSDKQGPYHIRLTVNDGTQTAVEHTVLWAEPDLHPGWPVNLGGSVFYFGGFILGSSYNATPADADHDGSDEIFIGSSGHTFGLNGDGTILPGWPTKQFERISWASSGSMPGPSVADVDNDDDTEVMWTQRDHTQTWSFNGKNLNGTNMNGFPQRAIEEFSNAFHMPFVLADLDNNGTLEAVAAHTKGNTGKYYRISAYDYQGNRLFTHDLEDENEIFVSLCFGDLDNNGQKDIVGVSMADYQNAPIYLHSFDSNGNEQTGYPILLYNLTGTEVLSGSPFLADVDSDGDLEIIVGISRSQSYIHCYNHDGTFVPGFPVAVDTLCQLFYYCLGDVTGDGVPEIIALANYVFGPYRVYAMALDGTVIPGFPFEMSGKPECAPTIVDVDNDGLQDICFTTFQGSVYAVSGAGQLIDGFPKKMSFFSTSGVSAGDVDGDGLFELITATMTGSVYVWDTPTPATPKNSDWPMRHINPHNTNVFERQRVHNIVHNITTDLWYMRIQDAINDANEFDEIVVYPGTYYENIDFDGKNLTLTGADPADWDVVEATIIDGNDSGAVVTFNSGQNATSELKGLTIRNAGTHGIVCSGTSPVVTDCIIEDSGIYGICLTSFAAPVIERNKIRDNATGILIAGNYAGNVSIKNNWIYNNGDKGIAVISSWNITICNNTIVDNSSNGIWVVGVSTSQPISNCIIWNNNYELTGCSATYSCIEGGGYGEGNISSDPNFVDADANDFSLDVNSPCIDAADGDAAPSTDIDGNSRYDDPNTANTGVGDPNYTDMGAYEYQG